MRHPLTALVACAAAVVLGACSAVGTVATAAGVSLVILIAALGWPQLLGAPARTSLTIVLAATGLLATWAVVIWPLEDGGRPVLLEPIAICIALGAIAAFMVQLIRGHGRPQRLESTAGTITGVAGIASAAGWTALARWQELTDGAAGALQLSLAASLGLAALCALLPGARLLGRVLGLLLAAAAPFVLVQLLPDLPLWSAVVGGTLAGLVTVLIGSLVSSETRRPAGLRASLALGVAPVALTGLLAYVVLRIMTV
ncbi:hypothetical protein M3D92_00240 [Micrococcus terreus]|uniref:hypothetical protein n=1 Tax=Micrococcus terreus TaxID=574650 RepID=UPI0021A2F1C1|nr:hypothetical protein [Micrococcus terreus]MCT2087727.1 hypothetical protein [Micrococcus terreus]MDK7701844.1 hypothetical protein [Micrococcus terreus]WOO96431.1 hypothetical protein R3I42_07610 [Micrococcus terreus]